ncbi:hypothetical protein D8B26_005818 [Coccidioides posadasii str. Silveira]|uniref:uncharacterized protein n=1 Tax=Coccidioides posadasii (strain RMSCC 757 / Silveira) TaxID=443226 RepID=UPI001BF088A1|nr:hypothetical protein D8B26_005818 [Coccidioides posadasii str. Silveira]
MKLPGHSPAQLAAGSSCASSHQLARQNPFQVPCIVGWMDGWMYVHMYVLLRSPWGILLLLLLRRSKIIIFMAFFYPGFNGCEWSQRRRRFLSWFPQKELKLQPACVEPRQAELTAMHELETELGYGFQNVGRIASHQQGSPGTPRPEF